MHYILFAFIYHLTRRPEKTFCLNLNTCSVFIQCNKRHIIRPFYTERFLSGLKMFYRKRIFKNAYHDDRLLFCSIEIGPMISVVSVILTKQNKIIEQNFTWYYINIYGEFSLILLKKGMYAQPICPYPRDHLNSKLCKNFINILPFKFIKH